MRTRPAAALSCAMLMSLAGACGEADDAAGGTAPSPSGGATIPATPDGQLAAALDGRTFLLASVEGQTLVEGSQVSIELVGGELRVSPGCNSGAGTFTIAGGALRVDDLAQTEMACDPPALMGQDAWVLDLLTASPRVTLDGDRLTLASAAVTMTFMDRQVADPDRPLEGTTWQVESLVEGDAVSSLPAGMRVPTLVVQAGRLDVDTGCNTGGSAVSVTATDLTTGGIVLTRMACLDSAAQAVETAIVAVLEGTSAYEIDADVLTVTHGDVGLVARAVPEPRLVGPAAGRR